jgi:hypothetical protein
VKTRGWRHLAWRQQPALQRLTEKAQLGIEAAAAAHHHSRRLIRPPLAAALIKQRNCMNQTGAAVHAQRPATD